MTEDLTRWNRAGRSRFTYLDGNAVTYLEFLRARLSATFSGWESMAGEDLQAPAARHDEEIERLRQLEKRYGESRDDLLWTLTRSFARACHVLGGYIDAYANEAYLRTATQWENVRKLVAMLDYHPKPPASATTSMVLLAKEDGAGTVEQGFQLRHAPEEGEPVIFETLEDLEIDPSLNEIRPLEYDRNPVPLRGTTLVVEAELDKVGAGDPVVLEDERSGLLEAYIVETVTVGEGATTLYVNRPLSGRFLRGYTWVHAEPRESAALAGPRTTGAEVGRTLHLTGDAETLEAGEVVVIGSEGKRPRFRRVTVVRSHRITVSEPIGEITLDGARVSRAVVLPVNQIGKRETEGDAVIDTVYTAGDWSRLTDTWVADHREIRGARRLPAYQVIHAKYVPVGTDPEELEEDDKEGYTALTLSWSAAEDDLDEGGDHSLKNPQHLLAPPATAGPWEVDTFLDEGSGGVPATLVTETAKKAAAGDLAVLVRGRQAAWARLGAVTQLPDDDRTELVADGTGWKAAGGGPYYLADSRVRVQFASRVRIEDWDRNDRPLRGHEIPVAELPEPLAKGRSVIVISGEEILQTSVSGLLRSGSRLRIRLEDPLPPGATYGGLVVHGNIVTAGHGVRRPEKVLGSGDAARIRQRFLLEAENVSFVPDATQSSGVRAAIEVTIDGRRWDQVATLNDSGPADPHFEVRMTEEGVALLAFGDGAHGRRLPTGVNNVRAVFRQGNGVEGNVAADSGWKPVKPHRCVDEVLQPVAATGGADLEAARSMREAAPASVLTLDRAVSLTDFAMLARQHSSIVQAGAFRHATGLARRESVEVVVVPSDGSDVTSDLRESVCSYLTSHAVPGVEISVTAYEPVILELEVVIRVDSDAFEVDQVEADVRDALIASLSLSVRRLGQSLYRSEVYRITEGVTGVENSVVSMRTTGGGRIVRGRDGVVRAVHPGEREVIHLAASDPKIDIRVEEYSP
jgi:hypothetical protein